MSFLNPKDNYALATERANARIFAIHAVERSKLHEEADQVLLSRYEYETFAAKQDELAMLTRQDPQASVRRMDERSSSSSSSNNSFRSEKSYPVKETVSAGYSAIASLGERGRESSQHSTLFKAAGENVQHEFTGSKYQGRSRQHPEYQRNSSPRSQSPVPKGELANKQRSYGPLPTKEASRKPYGPLYDKGATMYQPKKVIPLHSSTGLADIAEEFGVYIRHRAKKEGINCTAFTHVSKSPDAYKKHSYYSKIKLNDELRAALFVKSEGLSERTFWMEIDEDYSETYSFEKFNCGGPDFVPAAEKLWSFLFGVYEFRHKASRSAGRSSKIEKSSSMKSADDEQDRDNKEDHDQEENVDKEEHADKEDHDHEEHKEVDKEEVKEEVKVEKEQFYNSSNGSESDDEVVDAMASSSIIAPADKKDADEPSAFSSVKPRKIIKDSE